MISRHIELSPLQPFHLLLTLQVIAFWSHMSAQAYRLSLSAEADPSRASAHSMLFNQQAAWLPGP